MAKTITKQKAQYTEDSIRSLDWKEHIQMRPGMYIGKLGNGTASDDGIYILFKEVMDNSIDEYMMGQGKQIEVQLTEEGRVSIRDYGRGIPLGKVIDCVSKINTGGKYDSRAFQKAVGLNGVGTKVVNALSTYFKVQSFREGYTKIAEFNRGNLQKDHPLVKTDQSNGTYVEFEADDSVFKDYKYNPEFIDDRLWNYAYLNAGLKIRFNESTFYSKKGLLDLLTRRVDLEKIRYPIIHLKGEDIELALTHGNHGEQYITFVNGQHTTQGGTHLNAFRQALVKTLRDFYGKNYDATDIRTAIIVALSVRIQEPVFESQTKTKLGSLHVAPQGGRSINVFVGEFVKKNLDNFLHKNPETAKALQKRIVQSERERKEIAGIKKLASTRARKANLHNKKLRDCTVHYNTKKKRSKETMIFITEGDSASGSITKARDVVTQAVFSLRGKPLNCYNLSKKVVYENEEFNLLQHALNIENGLDNLRYNKVIVATDADVDGMHIRLLLLTFFLQFFPELVLNGHLYILETPLFRVRNKYKTLYCYDELEKQHAVKELSTQAEVTRFKGLGEISPDEFQQFIGEHIRLQPVRLNAGSPVGEVLSYYMGKNTANRQRFIIDNLRVN